ELNALRGRHLGVDSATVSPATPMPVGVQGVALEIVAEFVPAQAGQFGLKVRCAPDGSEQTLIAFEPGSGWLSIDRERSSQDATVDREPHGTHVKLAARENLTLRIFVDRSVIEVYANARATLASSVGGHARGCSRWGLPRFTPVPSRARGYVSVALSVRPSRVGPGLRRAPCSTLSGLSSPVVAGAAVLPPGA